MSRIIDDIVEIELNEKKFKGRLDLLALSECQFYMKQRGLKDITIPSIFKEIENENFFIICNLLIFCIKSVNPQLKMLDIYADLKFADRNKVVEALISLINQSMPKNDDDKKKEEDNPQVKDD